MAYDLLWFRELDDVYFEIWQRVTQRMVSQLWTAHQSSAQLGNKRWRSLVFTNTVYPYQCMTFALNTVQMSFKAALEEVYELNMFPLRQLRMKGALEHDYTMEDMEEEVGCFG